LNITVRTEIDPTGRMAKVMRPGVIGCFYSHYRLWEKCIALNEPILIFEDDVMFEREYIPVEWQEALLLCTGKDAHMHDFFSSKLYNPSGTPQAVTLPNTSMPGAVGYAIKPEAARKLVDYYREEYLPADNAMNAFVIKLECHTYLMGRAARAEEGKQSLTATKLWNKKL
jgi:glycosyl transferase family 25